MSKYLSMINRRIKKIGNDNYSLITYTQTPDPNNPLKPITTSSTDNIRSYKGRYKKKEIDGSIIQGHDIKLYVDPSTLLTSPTVQDKVTDGTNVYTIKNIDSWIDIDTIALYVFQLRV